MGLALAFLTGCAAPRRIAGERPFQFGIDTFAYANELLWDYAFDAEGRWKGTARQPRPHYTHRCFVVVRSAKQFFQHARFDGAACRVGEAEERRLVREVIGRSPRHDSWPEERVVIPGYANLREFSAAREEMLQEECGSFWESYFQRGHWRMILPFSRAHQARAAAGLAREIARNRPVVVHLVSFPSLRINHAVLLFAAEEQPGLTRFAAYDPNFPGKPTELTYHADARRFEFPTNAYFPGGRVKVYEVYCSRCY